MKVGDLASVEGETASCGNSHEFVSAAAILAWLFLLSLQPERGVRAGGGGKQSTSLAAPARIMICCGPMAGQPSSCLLLF